MANDVENLATVTDVLWIGGAAIAATGLVLTLLLRDEVPVAASAACTTEGCGLAIAGGF
jgi:hypothetical protein